MKRLLALAAALEAVTGLALTIEPSFVARLLLGADVSGPGVVMGRVAGFALVSLGLACWPSRDVANRDSLAVGAMLTYNLLITCNLIFVGIGSHLVGALLWPAVAIHGLITFLLVRAWFEPQPTPASKG
jgi:hypothetical protein